MADTSRIAEARRRAAGAKRTAVAVAAAGFFAVAFLARESHPATAGSAHASGRLDAELEHELAGRGRLRVGLGRSLQRVAAAGADGCLLRLRPSRRWAWRSSWPGPPVPSSPRSSGCSRTGRAPSRGSGPRASSTASTATARPCSWSRGSSRRSSERRSEPAAETSGLVDPTLGRSIEAAGYDRDFSQLPADDPRPAGPAEPGRWRSIGLSGRLLSRPPGLALDLKGVVKSLAVDAALELLAGEGVVAAGGDVAARAPTTVGFSGGGSLSLLAGGLATSGSASLVLS